MTGDGFHIGTSVDDPSGRLLALEAHDAGAVVLPVERPLLRVTLECTVHGADNAAELARLLSDVAALHDGVNRATVTVRQ